MPLSAISTGREQHQTTDGGSIAGASRQAGVYAGRILHGERVSDLPVQQVSIIELVVNERTAKEIGITIPEAVRNRAEELIE